VEKSITSCFNHNGSPHLNAFCWWCCK